MRIHLPLQGLDLLNKGGQHGCCCAGGGRVGRSDRLGLAQVLRAQHGLDARGFLRDVTAAGTLECRADLGDGQLRGRGGVRCLGQQFQGVGGVEVREGLQRGGEVLAQGVAQPLG